MHMRHPSNPDNVTATDQLAFNNVWKGVGWELVEKKDGEWVAVGKKTKGTSSKGTTSSSGSTQNATETKTSDSNSES